jgi:hypothetical protein
MFGMLQAANVRHVAGSKGSEMCGYRSCRSRQLPRACAYHISYANIMKQTKVCDEVFKISQVSHNGGYAALAMFLAGRAVARMQYIHIMPKS